MNNPDLGSKPARKNVIFFATKNSHKFEEAQAVLRRYSIEISKIDAKGSEIQADSIEEIATNCVTHAVKKRAIPIFLEDDGLFVEALNGFPGPFSSYVFKTIGNAGILRLLKGTSNRKAEFRSVVAFCEPRGLPVCFNGLVSGFITERECGHYGFGFDPIFEPSVGEGRTFAEMTTEEKSKFSHRSRALESFARWYAKAHNLNLGSYEEN